MDNDSDPKLDFVDAIVGAALQTLHKMDQPPAVIGEFAHLFRTEVMLAIALYGSIDNDTHAH